MSDIEMISQLVLQERRGRDRGRWHRMQAAYWPEATVNISWFTGTASGFIAASEAMTTSGTVATHRLAPITVDVLGDRALAEAPAVIEALCTVTGVEAVLSSYTRLQFRAERRAGEWRLLGLNVIYERDTLAPASPGEAIRVNTAELAAFRRSYRLLSWHLTSHGYPIRNDLLGDDRPAEIEAFYEREHRWLRCGD